jgi:hypothetical protein
MGPGKTPTASTGATAINNMEVTWAAKIIKLILVPEFEFVFAARDVAIILIEFKILEIPRRWTAPIEKSILKEE